MKYYGDTLNLDGIIQKTAHKSIKLIAADLLPHIRTDEENTLVLEGINTNEQYKLDSNIAYSIADYYTSMGIMLEQIEDETNQVPKKKYINSAYVINKDIAKSFVDILIEEKKHYGMLEEPKLFHMKLNIKDSNIEDEQYAKVGL